MTRQIIKARLIAREEKKGHKGRVIRPLNASFQNMAALTNPQKLAMVEALACFTRPVEVAAMMKEEHGVELELRQIIKYDPSKTTWEGGDDLRAIFEATRKHYVEDVLTIPIANQGYRLRVLQDLVTQSLKDKKVGQAAMLLEQAAKEVGGVLTNERNLKVDKTGSPLSELSPEERRAMVADMLRQALDGKKQQNAITSEVTQ